MSLFSKLDWGSYIASIAKLSPKLPPSCKTYQFVQVYQELKINSASKSESASSQLVPLKFLLAKRCVNNLSIKNN